MKTFLIEGCPAPLARARVSGRHVYDSQSELKTYLRIFLTNQMGTDPLITWPVHMFCTFYMGMPKSAKNLEGKPHKYRPDLSNLLKMTEDICNDIIIYDDSLISVVTAKKIYSSNPRTEFYFIPVEDHGKNNGIKGERNT